MEKYNINIKKLKISIIIILILGLFFEYYRPIIYYYNILDIRIVNSAPNFFFSMFMPCSIIYYKINEGKNISISTIKKLIFFSMLGILTYEFEQKFNPNMTFDYGDIIATILGSLLIFIILIKISTKI